MFINVAKKILLLITLSFFTVSCGGDTRKLTTDEFVLSPRDKAKKEQLRKGGNIFKDLIGLGKKEDKEGLGGYNISKKSPLWKASLDVLSTFPLANVDSGGGIIITDWYTSDKKPSERFKVTVLMLSPEIKVGSVKVTVHRQVIKGNRWVNKNIDETKIVAIERKIIQRAIDLSS